MSINLRRCVSGLTIIALAATADLVSAQSSFPNRPVRIMVGSGNTGDILSRLMAPKISPSLGQPVIIDNRVAIVSAETLARAEPDGHTLIFASNFYWLRPLMGPVSFDGLRDYAPVGLLTNTPFVVVVHPSLPVKSVKELIALAGSLSGLVSRDALRPERS